MTDQAQRYVAATIPAIFPELRKELLDNPALLDAWSSIVVNQKINTNDKSLQDKWLDTLRRDNEYVGITTTLPGGSLRSQTATYWKYFNDEDIKIITDSLVSNWESIRHLSRDKTLHQLDLKPQERDIKARLDSIVNTAREGNPNEKKNKRSVTAEGARASGAPA